MNRKIILLVLSVFIVAVAAGSVLAADAKVNTEIKMLSEKTLKNGDDIEFQLKDAQGNVIASQKINISFEANGKFENYTIITDKDGKGHLILYNEELGNHKVIINYIGNDKYNPSKLEETITIVEDSSSVTISPTRHWLDEIQAVCSSLTYVFSPSSRRHATTSIFSSWLNPVG